MLIVNIINMFLTFVTIMNMYFAPYDSDAIMAAIVMTSIVATAFFILWIIGIAKARKWTQKYNIDKFMEAVQ